MKTVLLIRPDKAGDAIKTLPVIRALVRENLGYAYHLLLSPHNFSLFEKEAGITLHKLGDKLDIHFDIAILLPCDLNNESEKILADVPAHTKFSTRVLPLPRNTPALREETKNIATLVGNALNVNLIPSIYEVERAPLLTDADKLEAEVQMGEKMGKWLGLCPFAGTDNFWERIQTMKKPDRTTYTKEEAKALHEKLSKEAPTLTIAREKLGEKLASEPKSPNYTDEDRKTIYAMQGTFQGFDDLINDYNAGKFADEPELERKLAMFIGQLEMGAADEAYGATGKISPIDGYDTDTTSEQYAAAGKLTFEEVTDNSCKCADGSVKEKVDGKCPCEEKKEEEPAKKCKCKKADGSVYEVVAPPDFPNTPCPCERTQQIPYQKRAPWWLQDTIKTVGAGIDLLSLKKEMPWQAPVMLERPKPVFMSPEREMANLNEQTKIATDALSQFAGPQAASARSSSIFGQGAKEAANVLQRYNNYNVNLANQFELKSTDIANQENMLRQAAATQLYDKNAIANQQYRNAKLAMKNQLRNYYTNAITNRWKTDALNQMYPQYEVDPSVGGRMYFDEMAARTIGQGGGSSNTGADYRELLDYYKNERKMSDADAINAADKEWKNLNLGNSPSSNDNKLGVIQGYYGKKGGTLKKGGYVYADILYPFIL